LSEYASHAVFDFGVWRLGCMFGMLILGESIMMEVLEFGYQKEVSI